jgi:hypothetical protein
MAPSGDGVLDVEILVPKEEKKMADIPESVATQLMASSIQTHQFLMTESQGNIQHANNMLRSVSNKMFDQLDSVEAQANRAVTVTPIGAPTTGSQTSQAGA